MEAPPPDQRLVPDKPLHVQVAEAIGWTRCCLGGYVLHERDGHVTDQRTWQGISPWTVNRELFQEIPRYDTDPKEMVEFMALYGFSVDVQVAPDEHGITTHADVRWRALQWRHELHGAAALGREPSEAVARLILKLAAHPEHGWDAGLPHRRPFHRLTSGATIHETDV